MYGLPYLNANVCLALCSKMKYAHWSPAFSVYFQLTQQFWVLPEHEFRMRCAIVLPDVEYYTEYIWGSSDSHTRFSQIRMDHVTNARNQMKVLRVLKPELHSVGRKIDLIL